MHSPLLQYFDLVCDKIVAHPSYSVNLERAAAADAQLVLNYHSHGPAEAFCVSVCSAEPALAERGLASPLEELAHIRGIGHTSEECGPRMEAFAERLMERYALKRPPLVFLNGAPFAG